MDERTNGNMNEYHYHLEREMSNFLQCLEKIVQNYEKPFSAIKRPFRLEKNFFDAKKTFPAIKRRFRH